MRWPTTGVETMAIHQDLKAQYEARIAELEAKLKAAGTRKATLKVSKAGAVSLYGFGKWPVTLYENQWTKVLDMADDIRAFLKEHDGELSKKDAA
jgi:hypothetical protein